MQNKLLALAILPLFLIGCATTPMPAGIKTVIQKVEVPIAVPCKVDIPARPEFNFDKLTEDNNIFDKVKAVLADRKLRQAYEEELRVALESCTK